MPSIIWTEEMSVGVPELDADHKVLIGVVNQIEAAANGQTRRGVTAKCLAQLRRYAEFHFAREEKVMQACNFPEADDHKHEHAAFIRTVGDLADRFDRDPNAAVEDELLSFLTQWLRRHILEVDMAYKPFAQGSPDAREAARSFSALEVWWT